MKFGYSPSAASPSAASQYRQQHPTNKKMTAHKRRSYRPANSSNLQVLAYVCMMQDMARSRVQAQTRTNSVAEQVAVSLILTAGQDLQCDPASDAEIAEHAHGVVEVLQRLSLSAERLRTLVDAFNHGHLSLSNYHPRQVAKSRAIAISAAGGRSALASKLAEHRCDFDVKLTPVRRPHHRVRSNA